MTTTGSPTTDDPITTQTIGTTEAVIDLGAIAHNTGLIRRHSGVPVMAVVKADGFGHGAVAVARTALASGATWLGVATLREALQLRAAAVDAPVLSWLWGPHEDVAPAVRAGVDLSVPSLPHLHAIARAAVAVDQPATVHLKADTGLGRNGCLPIDWVALVRAAGQYAAAGMLQVRGIWSHLAAADRPGDRLVDAQVTAFQHALAVAADARIEPPLRHLANSAGALHSGHTRFDLVRAGLGLYGVEPVADRPVGLLPAMTLRAHAVLTKQVPRNSGVSYGHDYRTQRDTRLMLVPLGYADGVPSAAGPAAEVWVGGHRRRVAGRIAMDQFVVDLDGGYGRPGDEVVVFGTGAHGEPTAAEWAVWAGCPVQEVFTGIGRRVTRRYTTGGRS